MPEDNNKKTKQGLFKGTAMQIEKARIMIAYVFQKHPKNFAFQLFIISK